MAGDKMQETFNQRYKRWYQSLTLWLNSISGILIAVLLSVQDNFVMLQGVFDPKTYQVLLFLIIVTNIGLRFRTSVPLVKKSTAETIESDKDSDLLNAPIDKAN